jgi:hypothetical protein
VIEDDSNLTVAKALEREPLGKRLLPPTAVHWGWWAAGLGMGVLIATVTLGFVRPAALPTATAGAAPVDKATAAMVREAILADPQVIPDAINRLQQMEVEKLLASNREAIETPFAGAWTGWGFHEDGIASAVRVDEGHMHLVLRGRPETLPVSRHFQALFKGQ